MKRSEHQDTAPTPKKTCKEWNERVNIHSIDFADDMLYEIFGWLPVSCLLIDCICVNSKWRRVVEEECKLHLDIDQVTWHDFLPHRSRMSHKITSLSVNDKSMSVRAEASNFEGMKNLKYLSLTGFKFDDKLIQGIVSGTALETIKIIKCKAKWSDLMPLADCKTLKRTWIDASRFTSDTHLMPSLDRGCLKVLSSLDSIESLKMGEWVSKTLMGDNIKKFYEYLTKMPNLTCLSVCIKPSLSEYLTRMPKLIHLEHCGDSSRKEIDKFFGSYDIRSIVPNLKILDMVISAEQHVHLPERLVRLTSRMGLSDQQAIEQFSNLKYIAEICYESTMLLHQSLVPKCLRVLKLKQAFLNQGMIRYLGELKHLERFSMTGCRSIDTINHGVGPIVSVGTLAESNTHLSESVSVLEMDWQFGDDPSILNCLTRLESLTLRSITPNKSTDDKIKFVADIPSLTRLELINIHLAEDGLARILSGNRIETIILNGNQICDSYFDCLQANESLKNLSFTKAELRQYSAQWISGLKRLRSLHIDQCTTDSHFAQAISSMKSLRSLVSTDNRFLIDGQLPYEIETSVLASHMNTIIHGGRQWDEEVRSNENIVTFSSKWD